MIGEARLLRVAVLLSLALHVVVIGVLARRGVAHPIPIDDLRVVAVGTYTPPAPHPEVSLPRELERRSPAPHPVPPQPRPSASAVPHPRAPALPHSPAAVRPVIPQPPVRAPRPVVAARPPAPAVRQPTAAAPVAPPIPAPIRPAPARPSTAPPRPAAVRMAQAPPRPALPSPSPVRAPGNSGGRLNLGSPSAAGTVPVGSGASTPGGHVPNEGVGGSGSGSGDVPRGRGGAEPVREPVHTDNPGPQASAPRAEVPPPQPQTKKVSVCSRSGLLAGPYCDKVVEKTFALGDQPDRRCDACKPAPAPEPEHVNRSAEKHEAEEIKPEPKFDYPPDLREAGVEGTVTLQYTVDVTGDVTNVSVLGSSRNRELDACAVRYIKQFRYKPASQNGQPRAVQLKKTFTFKIDG